MKITKYLIVLLTLFSITSCRTDIKKTASNKATNFKVEYSGALKNMMFKGDIAAKVTLEKFKKTEHFYALGAIENLKGEIQIFDSKPFHSIVIDSSLTFDNSFDKKATLLVYASVPKWKSISIPENIVTSKQLESYIAQTAKENQININYPFPFLIEGATKSIDWHVINWKDGDKEHTHEKHKSSGLHGTINNTSVTMLGFYSSAHHAIFTHHSTNMHIHVQTVDHKIAGHVDGLTLRKGMVLKIPDIK
ncbi:MAG: decarboxylase [Flavobacteriaceae bacterium]|nr:MAG: decarboxylase [Flavobacteriaceae bacterium]